ncbi:hypothetical protein AF72_12555 [Xylella taiwanensis]|uniref:Uncharacterized protein n=1 Tax=Xylella taiwanensis TaxID=1444770 RepID=Z9JGH9_9GAMM|nr:hypothetical protein AF72_12555 [Xylella taiwanensis]
MIKACDCDAEDGAMQQQCGWLNPHTIFRSDMLRFAGVWPCAAVEAQ